MHYVNRHKSKSATLARRTERELKGHPRTRTPRRGVRA